MKYSKQMEEARAGSQAAVKELEQLQNEKRKMLMEHETTKLKELDEGYSRELKEWKADLKPRKQVSWLTSIQPTYLENIVQSKGSQCFHFNLGVENPKTVIIQPILRL